MHELLAVYGTLRRGGRLHHWMGTDAGRSRPVGRALVPGVLHEVAELRRDTSVIDTSYPCLTLDPSGRVAVELYELVDRTLLDELDHLEGFDPFDLAGSEYHRVRVTLIDAQGAHGAGAPAVAAPPTEAWTYVYVRSAPDPARRIDSGDWIRFVAERGR